MRASSFKEIDPPLTPSKPPFLWLFSNLLLSLAACFPLLSFLTSCAIFFSTLHNTSSHFFSYCSFLTIFFPTVFHIDSFFTILLSTVFLVLLFPRPHTSRGFSPRIAPPLYIHPFSPPCLLTEDDSSLSPNVLRLCQKCNWTCESISYRMVK